MADIYIQGSFAFRCTVAEAALMAEAVSAGHDLDAEIDPDPPSMDLRAVFPPIDPADLWSGFREAFADPDFPTIGADFMADTDPEDAALRIICFASMADFDPGNIAMLIRRCCAETLNQAPIGFEWAVTCSRPRVGEFGGGWCAGFADRIEMQATGAAPSRALA